MTKRFQLKLVWCSMVRVKRRYILVKAVRDCNRASFDEYEFKNEIEAQVAKTYGDFGVACLSRGFILKKFDKKEGYIIIQLRKGVHEVVMSILPLITSVNQKPCGFNMLHLSGTVRSSFKHLRLHYIRSIRVSIGKQLAGQSEEAWKL